MWYLHSPDRATPIAETLEEVNKLYHKGRFKRFAISSYIAWQGCADPEAMQQEGVGVTQGVSGRVQWDPWFH